MAASQQTGQQRRAVTNGALSGLTLPVCVVGDHPPIALEFSPVDIAFMLIMQEYTPLLAWETHTVTNMSTAVFQRGLPTVAAVGVSARIDRVGQHAEKPAVSRQHPFDCSTRAAG